LVGWTPTGLDGFFNVDDNDNDNDNDSMPTDSDSERSSGNDSQQQQLSPPLELLRPDGFVLVLDRLSGSLTEKLTEWKHHSKQIKRQEHHATATSIVNHLFHPVAAATAADNQHHHHHHHRDEFWIERLDVLKQLANGIEYLHSNRIIHRDLKPDNVGFDYRNPNIVKIFDFNVARKLPLSPPPPTTTIPPTPSPTKNNSNNNRGSSRNNEDELFRLTRNVGSRRYMAPEVGQQKRYNQKVDVYSFGLIAYQILALPPSDKIFHDIYTIEQHEKRVFVKGERPTLPHSHSYSYSHLQSHSHSQHDYYWSTTLRKMIERSWSNRIRDRPSATALKDFFTAEIDFHKECMTSNNININNNNKILASSSMNTTTASKKSLKAMSTRRRHYHHHHRRHSSRG